jgi:hypothetical protein
MMSRADADDTRRLYIVHGARGQKLDANVMMRWNFWRARTRSVHTCLALVVHRISHTQGPSSCVRRSLQRMGRCPYFQVLGACIYENFGAPSSATCARVCMP